MEQKKEKKREESREERREVKRKPGHRKGMKMQLATWDMLPTESVMFAHTDNVSYIITPTGEAYSYHLKSDKLFKIRLYKSYTNKITLSAITKTNQFYYGIPLIVNNKRTILLLHRVVAMCYCENDDPEHKTQVDHIDSNTANNDYRNLEWVTPEENQRRKREKRGWKPCSETDKQRFKRCRDRARELHRERKRRAQEVNLFSKIKD